jgi:hypothetical protein
MQFEAKGNCYVAIAERSARAPKAHAVVRSFRKFEKHSYKGSKYKYR